MIVVTVSLFRHVCIVVKSAYYLRHVLSSVFPYVSAWLPMNGFPWNLIMGDFYETLSRKFKFG